MGYGDKLRRLEAVRRLAAGATTPGERMAALQAERRLERSLQRVPGRPPPPDDGPVAGHPGDPLVQDAADFDEVILREVLAVWAVRGLTGVEVWAWAMEITHRVLLPDLHIEAPGARAVEAVLQLAAARQLRSADRDAVLAFLDDPAEAEAAWRRWFDHWRLRHCA